MDLTSLPGEGILSPHVSCAKARRPGPTSRGRAHTVKNVGRKLLHLFCLGKSAFFNRVVTESDLNPQVRKIPITL